MSGTEEDISPVRISRLKKRSRGGRESTGSDLSPKDGDDVIKRYCKENSLNGHPLLKKDAVKPPGDENDSRGLQSAHALQFDDTTPNHSESTLGFMDDIMDSSMLLSIPSMLGIDVSKYKPTSTNFQECLERAFERADDNEV